MAIDFAESLKDLQMNNRFEISNLTLIAKENTEHAQAISKTLEDHIKTVSKQCSHVTPPQPHFILPASFKSRSKTDFTDR